MALALILSLAACGNDEPVKDNSGGEIPSGNGNLLGGKDDGEKEPEPSENHEDVRLPGWTARMCWLPPTAARMPTAHSMLISCRGV